MLVFSMVMSLGSYFPRFSFALNTSIYTTYKTTIESKYSEAERQTFKTRIDNLSEYKGRNEKQEGTLYESDITLEQILYYLNQYKNIKLENTDDSLRLNPYVYKKYKIIAYDEVGVIEGNQAGHGSFERVDTVEGKEVEYRYLGFTESGTPITNDFYPADFSSGTDPLARTYATTSEAKGSWEVFNLKKSHYGQLYQLMNTNLKNDDVTAGVYRDVGYTAFDLLKLTGFPGLSTYRSDNTVRAAQGKMVMMQFPSLNSVGQFKLIHGTYKKYYDTFRTQEMTLEADVTIYPDESVYFIAPNQEELTIEYEVRTIIDDSKTSLPYSNGLNISSVSIRSEGSEAKVFDNPLKTDKSLDRVLTSKFTKTVKVSDLDLKDGKDTVRLEASSFYTDMTDYVVAFNALPVTVTVNASSDFMADFTIHDSADNNVTDGVVTVPDLLFKTPYTFTLKDASVAEKDDIISREWGLELTNGSILNISSGNETEVTFQITSENRSLILHNGNTLKPFVKARTASNEGSETTRHQSLVKKPIPPQPVPAGPVAIIGSKLDQNSNDDYITMEGKVFEIHGRESYHPEGLKLKKYEFDTNGGRTSSTGSKKNDYIYYLESGKYYPEMTVTDENGGQDTDSTLIRVRSAEFIPIISIEGSLKENRKVSFSVENEHNLRYFPIDESSLEWTITPLNGQGDVVKIDGSANGTKSFAALFKKKGSYRVTVLGYINSGSKRYKGSASEVFTISEDLPPVANFKVSSRFVRNVNNENMTEIIVYDQSYSPDGDSISQRKYWYRYDDDNDGDFNDTDWILLSAANFDQMSVFSDSVGKYQFKVEVKEQFGQPTITRFVVDQDYRRGNTDSKADDEKKAEIINIAPTVSLDIDNKKPLTLVIYHDYDEVKLADLKNKLEILKAQLLGKRIDLKVEYLSPTETVGEREIWTTYFDTYISIDIAVEGEGSDYDERSSDSDDWDIKEIQTFNLFLDGFTSEGEESDLEQSKKGRFELVDVKFGDRSRHDYFGWRKDYTEFYWREIIIEYKDNGILKEKKYKFVYEWEEYYNGRFMKYDEFKYDKYTIVDYDLNVDEPFQNRPRYIETNHQFTEGDEPQSYIVKPTNTKRDVELKTFNQNSFKKVIEEIDTEDAFFLNLCSKEENRLALNKELVNVLKDKNISYLTLSSDSLAINPLSGRYDELIVGDYIIVDIDYNTYYYEKDLIIRIGELAYRLDQKDKKYFFIGLFNEVKEQLSDGSTKFAEAPTLDIYTTGYEYTKNYSTKTYYTR